MSETKLELPKGIIKSKSQNPRVLMIYGLTKIGKSSIIAGLGNEVLLIDLENRSDHIDAQKIKANSLKELSEIGDLILKENKPYKFICLDTVTALENMCIEKAQNLYRKSPIYSSNYASTPVLTLPKGSGFFFLRHAFNQVFDYILKLAPYIILTAHVKESEVIERSGTDEKGNPNYDEIKKSEVSSFTVDLIGKNKQIACSRSDAIAFLFRKTSNVPIEKGQLRETRALNFKCGGEILAGTSSRHLENQEIVISERINGEIVTHWNKIYLNED